jgi:hypothetical protein
MTDTVYTECPYWAESDIPHILSGGRFNRRLKQALGAVCPKWSPALHPALSQHPRRVDAVPVTNTRHCKNVCTTQKMGVHSPPLKEPQFQKYWNPLGRICVYKWLRASHLYVWVYTYMALPVWVKLCASFYSLLILPVHIWCMWTVLSVIQSKLWVVLIVWVSECTSWWMHTLTKQHDCSWICDHICMCVCAYFLVSGSQVLVFPYNPWG